VSKRAIRCARTVTANPVRHWLGKRRPDIGPKIAAKLRGRRMPEERRLAYSIRFRGAANPAWKGGVTPKNKRIRNSNRYAQWRRAVFERDDYKCQQCFARGVRLQADHIKPFADFPKLRFVIENGRTLCESCHRKTPTWGHGTSSKSYLRQEQISRRV
jgi:5-methylcytosine-specific restriction endonuclease McrA